MLLKDLKINFKWALDDGEGDLNIKIGEIKMHNLKKKKPKKLIGQ